RRRPRDGDGHTRRRGGAGRPLVHGAVPAAGTTEDVSAPAALLGRCMRRTKIVCTIGPASSSPAQLDRLAAAGMDVARLNFSHGPHAEHAATTRHSRAGDERWGRPVAILQDLQGPKIRLETFGEGGGARVDLVPGRRFTLTGRPVVGTAERASVTHPEFL